MFTEDAKHRIADDQLAARLVADTARIKRTTERKTNLRMALALGVALTSSLIVIAAGWGLLAFLIAVGKSFGL